MLDRLRDHLAATRLLPDGRPVIVGFSGGPDSTCLLHALHALGCDVLAAHLHHGQRVEADSDAEQCEALCKTLKIPFLLGRADVPRIAQEFKIGIEEAGRKARYEFFTRVQAQVPHSLIATGHTLDDQVETMLFHLARGSGLAGLRSIETQRDDIVRPLLPFRRTETAAYCITYGLTVVLDPSNHDPTFSRVRIRTEVIPALELAHPGAIENLARSARLIGEEDHALDAVSAAALEHAEIPLNGDLQFLTEQDEVSYRLDVLARIDPALRRRALRLALRSLGGFMEFEPLQMLSESCISSEKGSMTAEGGLVVAAWDRGEIHFVRDDPSVPARTRMIVPGETSHQAFGWVITADVMPFDGVARPRTDLTQWIAIHFAEKSLHLQPMESGDRMIPIGFDRERKLSDLIGEQKLTLLARRRLPLLCDDLGPIWAPGVCLAERARPLEGPALRLQFGTRARPG